MRSLENELKECARKLLTEKKVDLIIGYSKSPIPLRSTPCFIREEKDVDSLIFDLTCSNNLATYLQKSKCAEHRKPNTDPTIRMENRCKIGIIAKACDARSIVQLILEKQVKKEDITVIGIACTGILDLKKVSDRLNGKEILNYNPQDDEVLFEGKDFKKALKLSDILCDSCKTCLNPDPSVYDSFIGEPVSGAKTEKQEPMTELENLSFGERWEYFEHEISKCIRCYACRNACPLCYCEECVVDRTNPQWFGKSTEFSDTFTFHITRMLDTAGRCVGCGACIRACPTHVDLAPLGIKIEKEIKERFGYTAGLSLDATPPMATFNEDDKEEFIM